MQHATRRRRCRVFLAGAGVVLLASLASGGSARAQGGRVAAAEASVQRLFQDVAFSLFVLTTGSFSSGGYASYEDSSTDAEFNIYNLPARTRVNTGLLGPLELRLALGYGEATTSGLGLIAGAGGPPGAALASDRQFLRTWNTRFEVGRPIELVPDLVLLPLVGLGYSNWTGKSVRNSVGTVPVPAGRVDFWVDALLYEAIAILEYRHRWGAVNIRPGVSVNYAYIGSVDGRARATATEPGIPGAREKVELYGSSTVLRAGLRADGPLGVSVAGTGLRWQTFAVGNYETATNGLFPWSVETGVAVGADLDRLGRRLLGFDPGELYVGVSYLLGENLSGVRANFGFRF
jgi:hypothetical protein